MAWRYTKLGQPLESFSFLVGQWVLDSLVRYLINLALAEP